uniref:Uncharacterized protein n=1 Tax=Triticum urartu TaxID=4572 RepID=A0A8R7UZ66_TRIUA
MDRVVVYVLFEFHLVISGFDHLIEKIIYCLLLKCVKLKSVIEKD